MAGRRSKITARTVLLLMLVLLFTCCSVKEYPRQVSTIEKALSNAGYAIDEVGGKVLPRVRSGQRYNLERQTPTIEYSYYWKQKFKRYPDLFYQVPLNRPMIETVSVLRENRRYKVELIKWRSQYYPQNPDFALRYETYKGAHTAYAAYLHSEKKSKGLIIICHDWVETDISEDWRKYDLHEYYKQGYDALLVQQPYHGLRRLSDMAYSGESFLSGDLARINEAMCQGVTDVRGMIRLFRRRYDVLGLQGAGLGGTTCLLTAVVEKKIDFVIARSPYIDLCDTIQEKTLTLDLMKGVELAGLTEETIRKTLWVSTPSHFEPRIPSEDVLILAGMGDKMIPPQQITGIRRKWGPVNIKWYAGGHLANFQKRWTQRHERAFLYGFLKDEEK